MINKSRGQIGIGVILAGMGMLITAALGLAYNAQVKADESLRQTSDLKVLVAEVKTNVEWIKQSLETNGIRPTAVKDRQVVK